MGTTINPLFNGGPEDDESPLFPATTGMGMLAETRLLESKRRGKKSPKQIIKEAEGTLNRAKPKVKTGKKPENLRASGKKKVGPFGEAYTAKPAGKKGVRVAESRTREKAPPGWEGTVKAMKKHPEIDNPYALSWSMRNRGDKPHH